MSQCVCKTYEQGWRKWQGTQPDLVWLDEEPEDNEERQRRIYAEALTRLLTSHGSMMVTSHHYSVQRIWYSTFSLVVKVCF